MRPPRLSAGVILVQFFPFYVAEPQISFRAAPHIKNSALFNVEEPQISRAAPFFAARLLLLLLVVFLLSLHGVLFDSWSAAF